MSYAAFQCFTADIASCNRMHMSHLFFFSYARATLKYASGYNHQTGDRKNLLELLYKELVQLVHQAECGMLQISAISINRPGNRRPLAGTACDSGGNVQGSCGNNHGELSAEFKLWL